MSRTGDPGTTHGKRHGWILAGVDFSRPARQALSTAYALARDTGARLMVLHVIDAHGMDEIARLLEVPVDELHDRLGKERRRRLAELLVEIEEGSRDAPQTEAVISWGVPFEEILRKATDIAATTIVLGTMGRSADLERALFGSTAEKVLRSAPCPVLCVPTE
jgi:nucleotide-binding universal stress UspA family protein